MPELQDVTLESLNSIKKSDEKLKELNSTVDKIDGLNKKCKPDNKSIIKMVRFLVNTIGENETNVSQPALLHVVSKIEGIDVDYNDDLRDLTNELVNIVRGKYTYFALSLVKLVRILGEIYQADDDFRTAGRIFASVDTEDQYIAKCMSITERCEWRITTAQLFLQDGENGPATRHIQASKKLLRDIPLSHKERMKLQLLHQTCYSRILDSERKFLLASVNYMELSQINSPLVKEQDLLISLSNAVTCAILAPAGGNRTRVLAMLYRDERTRQLQNFRVLERMHLNMLLPRKEMDAFAETLEDHHQAVLSGGLTVLEKAVYEHNMLAASQIYKNIKISELSKLLGVNDNQAEDLARVMIEEGRMSGVIDQVDQIIEFKSSKGSELLEWDDVIQDVCMQLNDIVDKIDQKYPGQFVIP